jgi:hypothetical protein
MKKNYPYHLISDEEMFNAFIDLGTGFESILIDPDVRFFDINYPNPFAKDDYIYQRTNTKGEIISEVSLNDVYNALKDNIKYYILDYLKYSGTSDALKVDVKTGKLVHRIPDWVYTYMLGEVVYQNSEYLDIQDTLDLLGCYNIDNIFTREACAMCYKVSSDYISTLSTSDIIKQRQPTIFGEPHVIKSLRMNN